VIGTIPPDPPRLVEYKTRIVDYGSIK